MIISFNRNIKTPVYLQIKNQIVDKILSGEWKDGFVLPSERELSKILGLNRSTINRAYWELKADGFVTSQVGSGTVVDRQNPGACINPDFYVPEVEWNQIMRSGHEMRNKRIIKKALQSESEEDFISFAGGFVGKDILPFEIMQEISKECFSKYGSKILCPTSVFGIYELREEICKYVLEVGINASVHECMILSGSQQGIDYFARMFISPGDIIFTEAPTYIGAVEIFKAYHAKVIGIPIDENGMRTDILDIYLQRYKPKFIYTIPTYQNPSGTTMPIERRKKLLELCYLNQIPILEDDPYSEIGFDGKIYPSLKSLDRHGYVSYLSTFSKKFYMGGRIGWIICSREILKRFGDLKQFTDLHTNTVNQYFILEVLKKNLLKDHVSKLRNKVLEKKNLMVEEIQKHQGIQVFFEIPKGGFYIWLRLPDEINMVDFFESCKKEKVSVMPGDTFFPAGSCDHSYLRINYSYPELNEIPKGIDRLFNALSKSFGKEIKNRHSSNIYDPIV